MDPASPEAATHAELGSISLARSGRRWRRVRGGLQPQRLPKVDSPFLVGIHEPMRSELTLQDFAVTGPIPAGLEGRYLKMACLTADWRTGAATL